MPCADGHLGFRIVTWNCRALCHNSPSIREKKWQYLAHVLEATHICVLTEVHGYTHMFVRFARDFAQAFRVFMCPGPDPATGGVAIMWRRQSDITVHRETVCPGRVCRLLIRGLTSSLVIWAVHYDALSDRQTCNVVSRIRNDLTWT